MIAVESQLSAASRQVSNSLTVGVAAAALAIAERSTMPSEDVDLPSPDKITEATPTATKTTEERTGPIIEAAVLPDSAIPAVKATNNAQPELSIRTSAAQFIHFQPKSDEDEPPQSVIHAPVGFGEFKTNATETTDNPLNEGAPSLHLAEPDEPPLRQDSIATEETKSTSSPLSPPPITTTVATALDWSERATPRAQTRHDFEDVERLSHHDPSDLEVIPEGADVEATDRDFEEAIETFDFQIGSSTRKEAELNALRAALAECWTLCNTLASLSYIHRERSFTFQAGSDQREKAWRSCWRLCKKLYESQDYDYLSQISPTLDMCREFCQALFDIRVRDNELADSVLRVTFELNNHLFNTHDRNLPDAFRERTLDFYITLCHRLMKQRTRATETDNLLGACWSLAEMLFSIRQSKREGKQPGEELLGSAVEACWELCDIFREGWTLRSLRHFDRGTPRPSQATFTQVHHESQPADLAFAEENVGQQGNPETPTTIFEDTITLGSPDEAPTPNIVVLGHTPNQSFQAKWSSGSSSVSGGTRSSEQTASSSHTVKTLSEEHNVTRLKILITTAAINSGYQRNGSQSLASFVKSLSSDAFGTLPWQMSLLKKYKNTVAFDPTFKNAGPPTRATSVDISRAVQVMLRGGQHSWLRDLFRLVFGFHVEEALSRKTVNVQT